MSPIISGVGGGGSGGGTFYRKVTTTSIVNTVALGDLLNGEITVAAGVMGSTKTLRLECWGDWLNNTGVSRAVPRFQLVFGGTTVFDIPLGNGAGTSATRNLWHLEVSITNTATNAQRCFLRLDMHAINSFGANNAAFTVGAGMWINLDTTAPGFAYAAGHNNVAVDTTAARTLVLNGANVIADPNLDVRLNAAFVAIL